MRCEGTVCTIPEGAAGAACETLEQCDAGLECREMLCSEPASTEEPEDPEEPEEPEEPDTEQPGMVGEACAMTADCEAGLVCAYDVCSVPFKRAGEACEVEFQC